MSEESSIHPLELLLEEVALEGLDGITLSALWLRLISRKNAEVKNLDDHWKRFYYDLLKNDPNISCYELPKERGTLTIFDFKDQVEPYTNVYIEPNIDKLPVDIYPYVVINDEDQGIMGSCSTYHTRKNITEKIKGIPYENVGEIFGNKLVFVASQQLRAKYLMMTKEHFVPSTFELTVNSYCFLERIGRCRQHGCIDITRENVKMSPKEIFYHRRELLSRKWITKQTINKHKKKAGFMQFNLYFLNRFHVNLKSKLTNFMRSILENLKNASSTNYILPIKSFDDVFNCVSSLSVKKLLNFFHLGDKLKELDLPYTQVFPHLPYNECFTANNKEKLAPCIQLLEPDINIENELNKDFDDFDDAGSEEEEDDIEEFEEEKIEQEIETQSQQSWKSFVEAFTHDQVPSDLLERESSEIYPKIEDSHFNGDKFVEETMEVPFMKRKGVIIEKEVPFDLSLKKQFMKVVEQAGSKGCSAIHIQKEMKLSRCDIRNLIKHGVVYLHSYMKDEGRQRTQYFRLKKYTNCKKEYHTSTSSISCDVPCKRIKLYHEEAMENVNLNVDHSDQNIILETNENRTAEKIINSTIKDVTCFFNTDLQRHRARDAFDCISQKGFTIGFHQVYTYIFEKDKARNISNNIDRKTVYRILNKLTEHRFIKVVDIVVKNDILVQKEKRVRIYARNDYDIENETFRAAVQQAQMKFYDTKSLYISSNSVKREHETGSTPVNNKVCKVVETEDDEDFLQINTQDEADKNGKIHLVKDQNCTELKKEDDEEVKLKIFKNIVVEINRVQPTEQPIKNLRLLYPTDVMIHRANDLLEYIQENRVIVGSKHLQLFIMKCDKSRNYHAKIDAKTIKRLIEVLSLNNFITCFLVKFKNLENGFEKNSFICTLLDITEEHSEFSEVLKKEKLLFVGESNFQSNKAKPSKSSDYISLPKFARMEKMHKIAFHVAYSSTKPLENQVLARKNLECNARVSIPKDHPVIYNDSELNDFTFLPPISTPNSYPQGFFNFQDLYSVLPIGTIFQCLGRDSFAHLLDEYYRDPVKQFYPIKDTDTRVYTLLTRQFDGRKNVSNVYNIFVNLAAIGLVQLGKRLGVEKENFLIYVNKKTSLRDTMNAAPSYVELDPNTINPPTSYDLNNISDVKKFWLDLCHICVNTPLGLRAYGIGQKVNSYKRISDKAILSEVCKHFDDVQVILSRDNGQVPGDGLGAAGYDSSLYAHMKKNWNAMSKVMKAPAIVKPTRNTKKIKNQWGRKKSSEVEKKPNILQRIVKARKLPYGKKAKKVEHENKSKIIENSSVSENSRRRLRTQIIWNESDADALHLIHILYKQFKLKKCNRLTRDILVKLLNKKSKTCDVLSAKMLLSHYTRVLKITENRERCSLLEAEVNHREEVRSFLSPHVMKHRELCMHNKNKAHSYIFEHFFHIVKTIFEMVVVDNSSLKKDDFPTDYKQLLEDFRTIDTVETLDDLYPVTNNQNNIKIHVLLNLIYSSLASGSYINKENLNTCLFDAYQQYSEPLIHKAVRLLKKLNIIASTKYINKQLRSKNSISSISIARFKLSVRYISKVSQTDMQCNSFHRSYIHLKEVSQWTDSVQTIVQVDGGYLNLLTVLFGKSVKIDIEIPDTLLLFDPKLQQKNQAIVDRYYELVDYYKTGTVGKSVSEQEGEDNDDEDDEKLGSIPPMNHFNASRLAMYTLKDVLVKEHINSKHVNKLLTLNTCKVLVGKLHHLLEQYNHCKSEPYIRKLSQQIEVPALNQEQINTILTPGLEKELEQYIRDKLEAGATSEDIRLKFGASKKVKSTLDRLVEKTVIISTGCFLVTYVHNTCCNPWLLKTNTYYKEPGSNLKKEIAIVPWIHVDSTLNRPVLDYMLCIILSYIIFHPGVTLLYLQEQFASVLHPKHIIDLMDILVNIKCVSIQVVSAVPATLFSRGSVKVSPVATLLEPSHSIHIEALFDAGVKLGVFIGEKSYEKDFLSDILD